MYGVCDDPAFRRQVFDAIKVRSISTMNASSIPQKKKNNQKCSLLNLNSYIVGYTFLICSAQTENNINQLMNLFETNVQT